MYSSYALITLHGFISNSNWIWWNIICYNWTRSYNHVSTNSGIWYNQRASTYKTIAADNCFSDFCISQTFIGAGIVRKYFNIRWCCVIPNFNEEKKKRIIRNSLVPPTNLMPSYSASSKQGSSTNLSPWAWSTRIPYLSPGTGRPFILLQGSSVMMLGTTPASHGIPSPAVTADGIRLGIAISTAMTFTASLPPIQSITFLFSGFWIPPPCATPSALSMSSWPWEFSFWIIRSPNCFWTLLITTLSLTFSVARTASLRSSI